MTEKEKRVREKLRKSQKESTELQNIRVKKGMQNGYLHLIDQIAIRLGLCRSKMYINQICPSQTIWMLMQSSEIFCWMLSLAQMEYSVWIQRSGGAHFYIWPVQQEAFPLLRNILYAF